MGLEYEKPKSVNESFSIIPERKKITFLENMSKFDKIMNFQMFRPSSLDNCTAPIRMNILQE